MQTWTDEMVAQATRAVARWSFEIPLEKEREYGATLKVLNLLCAEQVRRAEAALAVR